MISCVVGYEKRPAILGIPGQHDNPPQTKGAPVPDQTTKEEKSAQPIDMRLPFAADVAEAVRLVEAWNHAAAAITGAEVQRLRAEDYKRQRDDARHSLASMTDVATKAQTEGDRLAGVVERLTSTVYDRGTELTRVEAELARQKQLAAQAWAVAKRTKAEAERYRDRCPVRDDDDVSAYTIEVGHAMCKAAGLDRIRETFTYETGPGSRRVALRHGGAKFVNDLAYATGRPAFDILDEMAAMTAEDA